MRSSVAAARRERSRRATDISRDVVGAMPGRGGARFTHFATWATGQRATGTTRALWLDARRRSAPGLTLVAAISDTSDMLRRAQAAASWLVLGALGCGGEDAEVAAPVTELSLVTFNAALGVGLAPYAEQRLEAIERALPDLGADVLCLQEVWLPEDLERLASALAPVLPYSHRSLRGTGGAAGCTAAEADLLASCLAESCAGVGREGLAVCAIASCAGPFTQVSPACQQCVAANQGASDVANLTTLCSMPDAASYADQTGLLLLSRLPLEDLGYAAFDSALGDRGLLSARVHTDFMGDVDVFCTHLAATLGDVPYAGAYGSWAGERLHQIEQALERMAALDVGGAQLLLGDLNCGPSTALAEAASPDAYQLLLEAGFSDPYAELDGRCTFCDNNPLNGSVDDPDEGALIDHVLVSSGAVQQASSSRVLDEVLTLDVGGAAVEAAHSDHYGVRVQLGGGSP